MACTTPGGPTGGMAPQLIGRQRLLWVGDSITSGYYPQYTNAYYWPAPDGFCALSAVGPNSGTSYVNQRDYGISASRCFWFLAGGVGAGGNHGSTNDLAAFLNPADTRLTPDIVSILLGTNGCDGDAAKLAAEQTDYAALLAYCYSLLPGARYLVHEVTRRTTAANNNVILLNASLPAMWDTAEGYGMKLWRSVGLYASIDPATDTSDGLHPNVQGGINMAAVIWPHLRQVCGYAPP